MSIVAARLLAGREGAQPCPRCAARLTLPAVRCGSCELPLTGPVAASLWGVDQRLAALERERAALGEERAALLAELAAGPASPAPRAGTPAPPDGPDPRSTDDGARSGAQGAQRVLLVAGVVLVTASALGLGALAVTTLGALGQLAVLALLVVASLTASRWSLHRGLGASGESFAVLAVALAATGAAAMRSRGVVGPETIPDRAWPLAVVAGLCTLSAVAAATLRRRGRPVAFGWAALGTGALVPTALAVLLGAGPGGSVAQVAVVVLLSGALLPAAAPALAGHGRVARRAVLVVAAAHLVAGALALVGALVGVPEPVEALVVAAAMVVLVLLCVGWVALARRAAGDAAGEPVAARPLGAVAVSVASLASRAAWVAAGTAVLTAASAGGADALVVTATLVAVVAVVAGTAPPLIARAPRTVAVTALATGVACLLLVSAQRLLSYPAPPGPTAPTWAPWLLLALVAAVRSSAARSSVAGWLAVSGACAVAAALALPADAPSLALGGDDARVPALVLVATLALALAALLRSRAAPTPTPTRTPGGQGGSGSATEGVLVATWAGAACLAALLGLDTVGAGAATSSDALPVPLRAVLAIAGAQALLYGLLPGRTRFRVVGVAALSMAWWAAAADVLPGGAPVEAWTLPPALLALVVGALAWRRHPSLSSWAVLGPALLIGLAPSTVVAVTVDAPGTGAPGSVVRPVAVVLVSLVLVRLGASQSWQAPLVLGASAAILVALVQVGPFLAEVPLWVTTGLSGVVVLVTAVRLEAARRSSARALGWLAALR